MIPQTPAELEYLIRKTVTYLEFHNDDAAKEIAAQWQQVLNQIKLMKKQKTKARSPEATLSPKPKHSLPTTPDQIQ